MNFSVLGDGSVRGVIYERKRLEDIRLELARPFEHEGRLVDLLERQRALLKALDLDKDEAGSRSTDAAEERLTA